MDKPNEEHGMLLATLRKRNNTKNNYRAPRLSICAVPIRTYSRQRIPVKMSPPAALNPGEVQVLPPPKPQGLQFCDMAFSPRITLAGVGGGPSPMTKRKEFKVLAAEEG